MSAIDHRGAVQLFERRRRAWLEEDVAGYLALWSEDMKIELPGRDTPVRGRSAYAEIVELSFARLRPVAWTYHHLAVDGAHVLTEWTIEASLRANDKPVAWRGMAVCRVEAELITDWREYWDPAVLRAQLSQP
jgi:ketosteroid isomerase-like protein